MNKYQAIKKAILFIIMLLIDSILVAILAILIYKVLDFFFDPPIWVSLLVVGIFGGITARCPWILHPWEWRKALRSRPEDRERE